MGLSGLAGKQAPQALHSPGLWQPHRTRGQSLRSRCVGGGPPGPVYGLTATISSQLRVMKLTFISSNT